MKEILKTAPQYYIWAEYYEDYDQESALKDLAYGWKVVNPGYLGFI